jgi:hypothetical protein
MRPASSLILVAYTGEFQPPGPASVADIVLDLQVSIGKDPMM